MPQHPILKATTRPDVLAGLMFIAVAALGLWLARDYPVGSAMRMGTGYMPRLLCWMLMALGGIVLIASLLRAALGRSDTAETDADAAAVEGSERLLPVLTVPASLIAFGLSLERLGLVASVFVLIGIASLAGRGLAWWETLAAAGGLAVLCWLIFIVGLGLTMPVWPQL